MRLIQRWKSTPFTRASSTSHHRAATHLAALFVPLLTATAATLPGAVLVSGQLSESSEDSCAFSSSQAAPSTWRPCSKMRRRFRLSTRRFLLRRQGSFLFRRGIFRRLVRVVRVVVCNSPLLCSRLCSAIAIGASGLLRLLGGIRRGHFMLCASLILVVILVVVRDRPLLYCLWSRRCWFCSGRAKAQQQQALRLRRAEQAPLPFVQAAHRRHCRNRPFSTHAVAPLSLQDCCACMRTTRTLSGTATRQALAQEARRAISTPYYGSCQSYLVLRSSS